MRYVTKPRALWVSDLEEDVPDPPHITVDDEGPVPTGLFDSHGNELYRMREPIGFRVR